MVAFSLHLKSFGPSIPQCSIIAWWMNSVSAGFWLELWLHWRKQMLRVTAVSAGREARKPNLVQSYQKTIARKHSWPILERCCIHGFTAYKAILMQVLLTNQWDPNPNFFLIIFPFLVGSVPLYVGLAKKFVRVWNPINLFANSVYCLSMNDDPHCRCLGVISDSLIFLFPHIELQILSFQPLDRLHFPKKGQQQ